MACKASEAVRPEGLFVFRTSCPRDVGCWDAARMMAPGSCCWRTWELAICCALVDFSSNGRGVRPSFGFLDEDTSSADFSSALSGFASLMDSGRLRTFFRNSEFLGLLRNRSNFRPSFLYLAMAWARKVDSFLSSSWHIPGVILPSNWKAEITNSWSTLSWFLWSVKGNALFLMTEHSSWWVRASCRGKPSIFCTWMGGQAVIKKLFMSTWLGRLEWSRS